MKEVPLNSDQLSSGLMAYATPPGDVLLRLEFRNEDNVVAASESVALLATVPAVDVHESELPASNTAKAALPNLARDSEVRQKSRPERRAPASAGAPQVTVNREREAAVSRIFLPPAGSAPDREHRTSGAIDKSAIDTPPALTPTVASTAPQLDAAISALIPKASPPVPVANSTSKPNPASSPAMGIDYTPPTPLKWTEPSARNLKNGSVRPVDIALKIHIDENGHVTKVRALNEGQKPSKELMKLADRTVKSWVFQPARYQGKAIASEDTIVLHVRN
jgi:hypothetical protein